MQTGTFLTLLFMMTARLLPAPSGLMELPAFEPEDPVYWYAGHALQYNNEARQADWVAYELTAEEVDTKVAKRQNKFLPDPNPNILSAENSDYYKSSFDRGHLAPSADMRFSIEAMRDCFYYSNISPQHPRLNRGIWLTLENKSRSWAKEFGAIFITAGPIFSHEDSSIGSNRVRVPIGFYKAILDYKSFPPKAIAFIFLNGESKKTLAEHSVSVDIAESITGLDFFSILPDTLEDMIESTANPALWFSSLRDAQ